MSLSVMRHIVQWQRIQNKTKTSTENRS